MFINIFFDLIRSLNQAIVFEEEKGEHYAYVSFDQPVGASNYLIYKNAKNDVATAAIPVHEGNAKSMPTAAGKSKFKCYIPTGGSKVKKDGSKYSFQFPIANGKVIFTEPFAYNQKEKTFSYASEVPTPFYNTWAFIISMIVLGLAAAGLLIYLIVRKTKSNKIDEEDL